VARKRDEFYGMKLQNGKQRERTTGNREGISARSLTGFSSIVRRFIRYLLTLQKCRRVPRHSKTTSHGLSWNNGGGHVRRFAVWWGWSCVKDGSRRVGHASASLVDGSGSATSVSSSSSATLLPSLSGGTADARGLDGSSWHSAAVLANFGDCSEITGDDLGVSDRSIHQCQAQCLQHIVHNLRHASFKPTRPFHGDYMGNDYYYYCCYYYCFLDSIQD